MFLTDKFEILMHILPYSAAIPFLSEHLHTTNWNGFNKVKNGVVIEEVDLP